MNLGQIIHQGKVPAHGWRIDGWGLLRGLVLLASSLLTIAVLHHVILAIVRG